MPNRLIRSLDTLCAVLNRQYRCHQGQHHNAAHNPALFIRRLIFS